MEHSNTGTSIGRWEGQTLVIETGGIHPEAKYPRTVPEAIPIGKNARVTERISLKDANTLEFDVLTAAPDLLIAYLRVPYADTEYSDAIARVILTPFL